MLTVLLIRFVTMYRGTENMTRSSMNTGQSCVKFIFLFILLTQNFTLSLFISLHHLWMTFFTCFITQMKNIGYSLPHSHPGFESIWEHSFKFHFRSGGIGQVLLDDLFSIPPEENKKKYNFVLYFLIQHICSADSGFYFELKESSVFNVISIFVD